MSSPPAEKAGAEQVVEEEGGRDRGHDTEKGGTRADAARLPPYWSGDPSAGRWYFASGAGTQRSFIRLHDQTGRPLHRLGERDLRPRRGTRLSRLLGETARVRMNHRFHLNADALLPNTCVLHRSAEAGITDALELSEHRFFIGLQAHPKLGCETVLQRLWDGFLAAAASHP